MDLWLAFTFFELGGRVTRDLFKDQVEGRFAIEAHIQGNAEQGQIAVLAVVHPSNKFLYAFFIYKLREGFAAPLIDEFRELVWRDANPAATSVSFNAGSRNSFSLSVRSYNFAR